MTVQELITALTLPASCRVDQRVPKKMLIENGARTVTDKRLLSDAIEEIRWVATLKPTTTGVPDYRDEHREYLEVAVLSIACSDANIAPANRGAAASAAKPATEYAKTTRLAELVHRAVPYPVLLLLATPRDLFLSAAHKRWAQNDTAKIVLDGEVVVEAANDLTHTHPFVQSVALHRQPQATLMALYQGWFDCLTALKVARYTGTLEALDDPARATARRTVMRECQRLEQEMARLRLQANKEKQMAKQVDLNMALKRIHAELLAARKQL